MIVVVEGGQISAVDFAVTDGPPEAALIDLGELTLLPGLVDAHTHLCWDPDGDPEDLADDPHEALVERARQHATAALHSGVTTIRDLGDRDFATLSLREDYRQGTQLGPELVVSGPPLTRTGGHCWYLGGAADSTDDLVDAVEQRAARGVDWIKVMATGGFVTEGSDPLQPQYDHDQLTAVVEAAHRMGLPVTAHAHAAAGIAAAVAAGVDGIEHCTFITEDGVSASPDIVERIVAQGVWCGITTGQMDSETPADIIAVMQGVWRVTRQLIDSGARVAWSSDAGISPRKAHNVLPADLAYLSRHGFTVTELLIGATSAAAASCGLGHRKGRITPGFDADLLAVGAGVNHDLTRLCDVKALWRNGTQVPVETTC
ncbi:amidohydrolase family protein [Mycobacterium spongiae]|uniref:Amidohydrolase family protein n=1 Tax=Mycobacterium spongiae TaxID=886343 RepID=A0A975PZ26_9MYCO|nr:amidohydrolase family protein [Mycobacterium spongiae]